MNCVLVKFGDSLHISMHLSKALSDIVVAHEALHRTVGVPSALALCRVDPLHSVSEDSRLNLD